MSQAPQAEPPPSTTNQGYRLEFIYGGLTLLMLGGLLLLERTDAFSGLDSAVQDFLNNMAELGAVGMFLLGIVGNASLLIQIPYTVPLVSIALAGSGLSNLLWLSFAAGIGAGVGEVISYIIADKVLALNPDLPKSRLYQWTKGTIERHPRLAPWLIFVWAASVLPDDTILIPLALVRYGLRRVVPPLFLGKVAHNLVLGLVLYYAAEQVSQYISTEVQTDLALSVLIVFIMVILYQVAKARQYQANNA